MVTIIVGTKADLGFQRAVSYEEARCLADELNATYIEVSSSINTNVGMIFEQVMS